MRNRILQKTALLTLACTTVFLLLMVELFSRYYLHLGDPPLSQTDPDIEYLFAPNQIAHPFGNLFKTNEYGMRSDSFPIDRGTNEIRILVIGDSIINGGNLTDQSHLATSLLQTQLRKKLNQPVTVGNISAGSWGPPNQLAYLQKFGLFNANIVIFVMNSDDYYDAPTFTPLNPLTHPTTKPLFATWEGVTRYLPRFLPTNTNLAPATSAPTSTGADASDIKSCSVAIRNLLLLTKNSSIKTYVLQHWHRSELDSDKPNFGHHEIEMIAQELGIDVWQDATYLQADIKNGVNPYRDDIHPNDAGQYALAKVFEAIVASNTSM